MLLRSCCTVTWICSFPVKFLIDRLTPETLMLTCPQYQLSISTHKSILKPLATLNLEKKDLKYPRTLRTEPNRMMLVESLRMCVQSKIVKMFQSINSLGTQEEELGSVLCVLNFPQLRIWSTRIRLPALSLCSCL